MWFLDQIISWLGSARDSLYSAYLEVRGWIWPFHHLSTPLYDIYTAFFYLTIYFSYFNDWVTDTATKLTTILSYTNISSYFSYYFDAAINAWNWVVSAWGNVINIIGDWWATTSTTVLGWIDVAWQSLEFLIDQVDKWVGIIAGEWEEFKLSTPSIFEMIVWFVTWPARIITLIIQYGYLDSKEIDELTDSKLRAWSSFWDGWQDVRDWIMKFNADPLGQLLELFEDWFWGKEE